MARLVWTEGSIADLEHIRRYVTAFHPAAARRLADRIARSAATLTRTRSIDERVVIYPYLLRYRTSGDAIVVMAVRHSGTAWIT